MAECEKIQERFAETFDDPEAETVVLDHTESCPACLAAFQEWEDTVLMLDQAASALPPPGALAAAVGARIRRERRERWLGPLRRAAPVAGAAAAVCVAGLAVTLLAAKALPPVEGSSLASREPTPQRGSGPEAKPEPNVTAEAVGEGEVEPTVEVEPKAQVVGEAAPKTQVVGEAEPKAQVVGEAEPKAEVVGDVEVEPEAELGPGSDRPEPVTDPPELDRPLTDRPAPAKTDRPAHPKRNGLGQILLRMEAKIARRLAQSGAAPPRRALHQRLRSTLPKDPASVEEARDRLRRSLDQVSGPRRSARELLVEALTAILADPDGLAETDGLRRRGRRSSRPAR